MTTPLRIFLIGGAGVIRQALKALIRTTPGMLVVGETAAGPNALEQALLSLPDVVMLATPTVGESLELVAALSGIPRPPRTLVLVGELEEVEMAAASAVGVGSCLPVGTAPADILQAILALCSSAPKSNQFATPAKF